MHTQSSCFGSKSARTLSYPIRGRQLLADSCQPYNYIPLTAFAAKLLFCSEVVGAAFGSRLCENAKICVSPKIFPTLIPDLRHLDIAGTTGHDDFSFNQHLLPTLKNRVGVFTQPQSFPAIQGKGIVSHQCPDLPGLGSRSGLEPTGSEYPALAYLVAQLPVQRALRVCLAMAKIFSMTYQF